MAGSAGIWSALFKNDLLCVFDIKHMCAEREHWLFFFFQVQQKSKVSIFSLRFSIKEFHEGGEKTLG